MFRPAEPKIIPVKRGTIFHSTEDIQYAYNQDAHEIIRDVLIHIDTLKQVEYHKMSERDVPNDFWKEHREQLRTIRHNLEDLARIMP